MKRFFWNDAQNRPRALWRILLQVVIWLFFLFILQLLFLLFTGEEINPDNVTKVDIWLRLISLIGSLIIVGRYIDKRPFSQYGVDLRQKAWWADFGFGLFMGLIMVGAIFVAFLVLGWVEIVEVAGVPRDRIVTDSITFSTLTLFAFVLFESLWVWSYVLRNLAEGFVYLDRLNGRVPVIAALLFALLLFIVLQTGENTRFNTILMSNLIRAGLLLALPLILTQRLGMTVGLALGWNMAQDLIFGFPNIRPSASLFALLRLNQTGPEAWTGGATGLGTGLMAMLALLIASGIITLWEKRRTGKAMFDGSMAHYATINNHQETGNN